MRMYDIIEKKRDGGELTDDEIRFFIEGVVSGQVPDYQASALLMAIYLQGMNATETCSLTMHMMHSGDTVDLSRLPGPTVDKHSTGGVGDKTSLAVVPMIAAMDPEVFVAKMSGRGLGHTGGTLDKLESIPGLSVEMDENRFLETVRAHGAAIIGQTGNLVPADKILYGLRDVTATVSSIPLIASSIMSKKLAAGASCILLDVKVGSGAFMKTVPEAIELARTMVTIGENMGRHVEALVTNMDRPLGHAIGNALEIEEVVRTLKGCGPRDLTHEAIMLASRLLALTGRATLAQAEEKARAAIANGSALAKLREMVAAQGGEPHALDAPDIMGKPAATRQVVAPCDGYVQQIDTEAVGIACATLGAGRTTLNECIDHTAGIVLLKNVGDALNAGEPIAVLHASSEERLAQGCAIFESALTLGAAAPTPEPLLYAIVTREGVEAIAESSSLDPASA